MELLGKRMAGRNSRSLVSASSQWWGGATARRAGLSASGDCRDRTWWELPNLLLPAHLWLDSGSILRL